MWQDVQTSAAHSPRRTNLLSFARQRKPERAEVDVRKVLDETLALRDYDLKGQQNRTWEKDLGAQPRWWWADPHRSNKYF